ncbi:chemotaxis protein CheA [Silvanigrella aquatica]|uniref:Chemotaxis protein CheA n=1 Tax=Silvanigrella aquatica TaxID=1915309 RepID=A0A1L4CYU2_9BACT|nr:chemotaxis protein CheA [Silvanigrella aquatica]APJ03124.1 hypothetical protein AXG55_04060 [Silvanigrella aquatica]
MDEDFEKELRNTFFQEADINTEESEEVYLQFSENTPMDLLSRSFRLAHNLKGSAKAVGFAKIADILHHLESLLLRLKKKELEINNNIINTLLKTNDKLKEMISNYKINMDYNPDISEIIHEISNIIHQENKELTNDQASNVVIESIEKQSDEELQPNQEFGFFAKNEPSKSPKNEIHKVKKDITDDVIRIPLVKIEKLQNYVGEIVIAQSMFDEQIKNTQNQILKNSFRLLKKTTKKVQDIIMSLRLVPIKPIFQKLDRTARDTSAMLNKKIKINFSGDNTEIDKFILDELSDPLMHMVRNAIDHGLEFEEERELKNKSKNGNIYVKASHESGNLVVEIQDDGKGLNPKILYDIGVKRGLIKEGQTLSENECYELIFLPGFSTKEETTEISGRGVGMDVVKTNISMLNGNIDIFSKIDKGTTFKIKIPLSIGIMDAFIAEIANDKFVIPVSQVIECLSLSKSNVTKISSSDKVIILRNEEIPIIDLALGLNSKINDLKNNTDKVIIITQKNNKKIGVTIDKIISIQSVVTKSIGEELRCGKGISGSVILGDGRVVPILEVSDLVSDKLFQQNFQRNLSRQNL